MTNLIKLILNLNKLGDEGVKEIAAGLKHLINLEVLVLNYNDFKEGGSIE